MLHITDVWKKLRNICIQYCIVVYIVEMVLSCSIVYKFKKSKNVVYSLIYVWHIREEENWVWLQVFLIYLKMLQVILLHDFIVAVAVVYQVVAHIVDWVLYKWSLVPHTPNWVVAVAEEPCLLPLLPLIIMFLQNLLLLMLNIASFLSSSCFWRFRWCCCWPLISDLSSWR